MRRGCFHVDFFLPFFFFFPFSVFVVLSSGEYTSGMLKLAIGVPNFNHSPFLYCSDLFLGKKATNFRRSAPPSAGTGRESDRDSLRPGPSLVGVSQPAPPRSNSGASLVWCPFPISGILSYLDRCTLMMSTGLEAKRENAGTKKSPLQIQMLERFYSEVQYPKPENMAEYATSVGLAYSQVRIWFKERRRKERREMEAIGAHMERQLGARSNGLRCNSSRSSSFSQGPMYNTVGLQPEDDSYVDRVGDTTCYRSYQNQRVVKKIKIMESTTQRSTLPCEDSGPVRKHGIGKGLMTLACNVLM